MNYSTPTQTPEGYSYSSTYLNPIPQSSVTSQPQPEAGPSRTRPPPTDSSHPSKKPRLDPLASSSSTSTGPIVATQPAFLPTRTRIPLKPGQTEASLGAWRSCSQAGCGYVGPDKEVMVHEEDRHLIFKEGRGRKSEEEEEALKNFGPSVPIPGTSIKLETEEEIAAWIAERKKRWPTTSRVAEKEKERQEKIARGEITPYDRNSRGGRGRGRGRGRGGFSGYGDDEHAQGRGRGRGRGRGGRGGGGGGAYERDSGYSGRTAGMEMSGDQDGGNGGAEDEKMDVAEEQHSALPRSELKEMSGTVLGSLAGYASSDEEAEAEDIQAESETKAEAINGQTAGSSSGSDTGEASSDDDDDDEPEVTGIHNPVEPLAESPKGNEPQGTRQSGRPGYPVCRFFSSKGYCRDGKRCKFQHIVKEKTGKESGASSTGSKNGGDQAMSSAPVNPFSRPSLLGAMLQLPLQQTLLDLSLAIEFLVDNDFLDDVELRAGQAEEEERERERREGMIVVVGDGQGQENGQDSVDARQEGEVTSAALGSSAAQQDATSLSDKSRAEMTVEDGETLKEHFQRDELESTMRKAADEAEMMDA